MTKIGLMLDSAIFDRLIYIVAQRKTDEARWRTSVQRLRPEVIDLLNISGMPIPSDCSVEDFEHHVQNCTTQVDKSGRC